MRDLNVKSQQVQNLAQTMETLGNQIQTSFQTVMGEWRVGIEAGMKVIGARIDECSANSQQCMTRIIGLEQNVSTGAFASAAAASAGQVGGGAGFAYGGGTKYHGLIAEKELGLPEFPGKNPGVEEFRRWLKDFTKHVERNVLFRNASILFAQVRKFPTPLDRVEDIEE